MELPRQPGIRIIALLAIALITCGLGAVEPRSTTVATASDNFVDFNEGWCFHLGDVQGAEQPKFADAGWRKLDLPHDWSVELPQDKTLKQGGAVGYFVGGIGWYRKTFSLSAEQMRNEAEVIFDGVQQDGEVWINGHYLGLQPQGYIGFIYNLTPYLRAAGEANVLAVRAVCPEMNSRWYSGAGIYRPVQLRFRAPVDVATWGIRLDVVSLEQGSARVQLRAEVCNASGSSQNVDLTLRLHRPDKSTKDFPMGTLRLAPRSTERVGQVFSFASAEHWTPDSPVLYTAELLVLQDGKQVGGLSQMFGVRTVTVSATEGFKLNGQTMKLRGGCLHQDNGIIGATAFAAAEWRRVELMKQNGFNAIRTSHNPPSSAFLEACDRLGILVLDEFADSWQSPKVPNGYTRYFDEHWEKDLTAMIRRDYNHPSVVIWSVGNEIPERLLPSGIATGRRLVDCVKSLDPFRPVTNAFNKLYDSPQLKGNWDLTAPAFALLDIGAYNYMRDRYENDHVKHPDRVMVGTETYPKDAYENWQIENKMASVVGGFVWTAMDYIGESGVATDHYKVEGKNRLADIEGPGPIYVAWCGDMDLIGNKKPQSYYRDVVWDRSPVEIMVHRPAPDGATELVGRFGWPDELPSWTYPGAVGKVFGVRVFSKAPRVRLELNGKPVGEQAIDAAKGIVAQFEVPYSPGELKATALGADGTVLGARTLTTFGAPANLVATPELQRVRAGRDQVVYVPIEVQGKDGRVVDDAQLPLSVAVTGAAERIAFGTANPAQIESFLDNQTTSFHGRALLVLRSTGSPGRVQIKLTSPNLPAAESAFKIP